MRPKKVILLIDENEITQSTTRFLLETKGYRVLSATTTTEALDLADSNMLDLVVLYESGNPAAQNWLSLQLKDMRETTQILFMGKSAQPLASAPYFDFFLHGFCSAAELIDWCKTLCARKRGPQKKPVGSVGVHTDVAFIRGCA